MVNAIHCRAEPEEDALRQAVEHAREEHDLEEVTDEVVAAVKAITRDA